MTLVSGCVDNDPHNLFMDDGQRLFILEEIPLREGYRLVGASAYGAAPVVTYFCEEIVSGRIFECDGNRIGREIIIPEGYKLVGAYAEGRMFETRKYLCEEENTHRAFFCGEAE